LKRLAFETGRAYCLFQEFSSNAPKNQIIRSSLLRMVQIGQFGPDLSSAEELKQKLRRLVRDLDGIDLVKLSPSLIHRELLVCKDDDYRLMLTICELILRRQMPTEEIGYETLPGFDRDVLTIHQIYERFVANFYRARLEKWRVTRQKLFDWHATKSSEYLPAMRPDLVLEHKDSGHIVVLDTKFTPNSLISGRFDRLVFDSSHLYQIYSYVRSQEQISVHYRYASGVLLYPTVRQHLSEELELQGHSIRFETVDLSRPWTEIETRLLEVVACTSAPIARES
jgi:5-methylcytosine-specific restriction enzyme subunit McrC